MDAQYKEGLIISLSALAAGTFIYVTFFEVIATERVNEYSNLAQLAAIIAGFSTVAAFQLIEIIID
ncbi:unnamed protein product [Dracunculus medinensis]|uniref:Zinc/iron permease n=1 Tax=Dracunculus medinensis TaxID=318479 RepID=A0A0N4USC2_DRAME|nr:unnamed protein product [Dracunculus medinensis]